ncbi:CehA/McbA family metallohydrolase [Terricaulis silvestris]|uniref:Uncharacterized protein n=1 Tax=Terricaulis silvestris TaxID=2686094 RepID=A0A6I6MQ42_9CAUL|nr:CehA/McbA family metallohydrolase [Terricaulis silvestris]QGZ94907.1 hypothetical protein DSM104635_01742 [Terricaulis silvestris]
MGALIDRRALLAAIGATATGPAAFATEPSIPPQPYFEGVDRVIAALERLGAPISDRVRSRIATLAGAGTSASVAEAEALLAPHVLLNGSLNGSSVGRAEQGGATPTLIEQGWRVFLIRVENPSAQVLPLAITPSAASIGRRSGSGAARALPPGGYTVRAEASLQRPWIVYEFADGNPLSGAAVEYKVVQVYSRDRGRRRSEIVLISGADPGLSSPRAYLARFSDPIPIIFEATPSNDVVLRIRDQHGESCMASVITRDSQSRIFPLQGMRVAPDLFFQPQIYRATGETVRLPDGPYTIESWRGPEYLKSTQSFHVARGRRAVDIQLQRWIDPSEWGWYSGDPHIHASGCAHYDNPTEGVTPETMIRHVRGEALSMADVLTWGPGYYYQRQFFSGRAVSPPATLEHPEFQEANNSEWRPRPTAQDDESWLRYGVEVSGFPSSHSGHVSLLRLADQNYPGASAIEDWPSWCLPILQWGKAQNAIVGFTHSALGLRTQSNELPNYEIPQFDSIGANEAIIDVTHDALDFISGCQFPPAWELNIWYHLLNCGYRLGFLGETDFPCITGERPGHGRTYVQMPERPVDDAGYNAWISNLKLGKVYSGDGRSHFLAFSVNGHPQGTANVALSTSGAVQVEATICARLESEQTDETRSIRDARGTWSIWHLEKARIGDTRTVMVELVVNGQVAAQAPLEADGEPHDLRFSVALERSSWVALRILPSGHTHPIFVTVAEQPIRASRRSAEWCRQCVDKIWDEKRPFIRESEQGAARAAYDHARRAYDAIISESEAGT